MNRSNEWQRLADIARRYMDALASRRLGELPYAPDVKNTENTVELPVGSGIGRTIRSLHKGGQTFVDVEASQVEYWGVAQENLRETIIGVRLKVEGLLISEIETMTIRSSGEYFNTAAVLRGTAGFHDVIAPEERVSRTQLIEVGHLYFDGIERSDGSFVPAREDALRVVNGAGEAGADGVRETEIPAYRKLSVRAQMTGRYYSYIESVRERRPVLVDEERGLVLFHVMFDHPAASDGSDGVLPWPEPNTVMAFEAFKLRNGEIEKVWALGVVLPFGIRCGWSVPTGRLATMSA